MTTNMKTFDEEAIASILVCESYTEREALVTAHDLTHFEARNQDDLNAALLLWLENPTTRLSVTEGEISTDFLMQKHRMTYPAALVMIDWLRSDPKQALACLTCRG